ncbi:MAG: leucine-rich repeat protein [Clostridia bacterium]|nr:leucine-rich repeat protein [Clostridia bacterium]
MKNNKKGISLIVLVITIIVMIILAASVVITLSNTGIIGKASEATTMTDLKSLQQEADVVKALELGNIYTGSDRNLRLTKALLLERLHQHFKGSTKNGDRIITADGKYVIIVGDDLSITIGVNEPGKKNELTLAITYNSPVTSIPYKVYVTPTLEGWKREDAATGETYSSYEEYAEAILATVKSESELEQLFVEGNNYWNAEYGGMEPMYQNINQLVATWSLIYDSGAYTTLDGMIEHYGFESLGDLALSLELIKPEGYYGKGYIEFAENELKNTTKTYEEIYMEGRIYLAETEEWGNLTDLKNASTFAEFVESDMGIPNINNMDQLLADYKAAYQANYMTKENLLIVMKAVEPKKYSDISELQDGEVLVKGPSGKTVIAMSGETVEITMISVNETTFEAVAFNGKTTKKTFNPESNIAPQNYTALDTKFFEFEYDSTTMTATLKKIKDSYQEVGYYEHISLPAPYTYPKSIIDDNGTKITDIIIPSKVVNPADNKEYTITAIASYAFSVPSNVTGSTQPSFTSLILPETITTIGDYAFFCWNKATKLVLPKSLTTVGYQTFSYWNELDVISYSGTQAQYSNILFEPQWSLEGKEFEQKLVICDTIYSIAD